MFGYVVDSCPVSQEETTESATRLGCGEDENGRSRYVCVPNQDLTALVEFCYTKTIVGIYQEGNCLRSIGNGFLDQVSCRSFTEGCPKQFFRSSDLYKYPACLHLNTEEGCFIAESWCNASKLVETSTNILGALNMTTDFTSSSFSTTRTAVSDEPVNGGVIAGIIVTLLSLILLGSLIAIFTWRRWRSQALRMRGQVSLSDNTESLHLFEGIPGTSDPGSVWKTRISDKQKHVLNSGTNDPGSVWKTRISDRFSTLTVDEVSGLFCFMCSDSGPPDFSDIGWLDMLNKIRQDVYYKDNPVTRTEAKQILDRLRLRDYLWEDQIKEHLTEDAQDEIMHRVSSPSSSDSAMPFHLSSFFTANRYLRLHHYNRKPKEKCVISHLNDNVLIRRLQMNILTHVSMKESLICDNVSEILNVPKGIVKSKEEQRDYQKELKQTGERIKCRKASQDSADHVTWLWRYGDYARPDIVRSCIGLHPHWDIYITENKAFRKPSKYHSYLPDIRCLLYCLLLVDDHSLDVTDQTHKALMEKFKRRYFPDQQLSGEINLTDSIVKEGKFLIFKSTDILNDVMYAFVTECLVVDSDLEFFLTTASSDVVSEYCRSWDYKRSEGERCLYVPRYPEKMYNLFIDKLHLDIITHCTMSDREIHDRISNRLNVPNEILSWDLSARKRFVENSKLERVEMFSARGMIVGCAGAGKTTLLRRLQRKIGDESKSTETTVGIEVHEDLFKIVNNTIIDISEENTKIVNYGLQSGKKSGKKLISMTDFAGQVAYYACHQVYLSRRAFYIIVIDMSKGLDEKACNHNVDRHDPQGSLFHEWNFKDYFHFWLQSIKTYCDEENTQTTEINKGVRGIFHPVILIASHKDEVSLGSKEESFYGQLEKCLSEKQTLKELISLGRYFEVECPAKPLTNKQEEKLEQVRKCIVETVKQLPQWGEKIPLKWAKLENFFQEEKKNGKKVIARKEIKANKDIDLSDDDDLNDALRFFHEIGQLIYFSKKEMKNVIIINVQWFVDGFKYIITDETHLARKECNSTLNKTGKITGKEMEEVWRKEEAGDSYIRHKQDILPYLDKLGLMTRVESKDKDTNDELYYIPSMNRIDLAEEYEEVINRGQKTSIILFHFKTYLPHFFFFRLVVKCLNEWKALDMEMFCKNAAFYKVYDASHYIVIAVNKTSIQLQVFTPEKEMDLQTECVVDIRETVQSMIHEITQTFHRQSKYEIGYTCKDINITEEDEEFFLTEEEVIALKTKTRKRPCPKHVRGEQFHNIDKNELLRFWRKEDTASSLIDNYQIISESEFEADP